MFTPTPSDFESPGECRPKVHENVQRDRLIVETVQWSAERLLPKVYGPTSRHEVETPTGPVIIRWKGEGDGEANWVFDGRQTQPLVLAGFC